VIDTRAGRRDGVENRALNVRSELESHMNCPECRTPMRAQKEDHRYDECGLKYITLIGVRVARCPSCGNHEISIPHLEELHRLLARVLIEKSTRFTGDEVRFLRKSLGWSGADFAKHMGVAEETVSRWENDAPPIGPQADRLLRFLIAQGRLTTRYPMERLAKIDLKKATATRVTLITRDERWSVRAA
jgi:putative zinc finger/helix-turn-helix YgiT family protein